MIQGLTILSTEHVRDGIVPASRMMIKMNHKFGPYKVGPPRQARTPCQGCKIDFNVFEIHRQTGSVGHYLLLVPVVLVGDDHSFIDNTERQRTSKNVS